MSVQYTDTRPLADLREIQTALELYYSDHGSYPCEVATSCPGQTKNANGKIGEGAGIDTLLAPYLSAIPHDPLGPGNASYYYYYDGMQGCAGKPNIIVLFARNMETTTGDHSYCTSWGGEGGAGQPNSYDIYIGPSRG